MSSQKKKCTTSPRATHNDPASDRQLHLEDSPERSVKNRKSRRKTVVGMKDDVQVKISDTVRALNEIWDEVEMDEQLRVRRSRLAFDNIAQLCDEMIESEKEMVLTARRELEQYKRDILDWQAQMEVKKDDAISHLPPTIKNLRALKAMHAKLRASFEAKMEEQKGLLQRLELLQFRLGVEDKGTQSEDREKLMRPSRLELLQTEMGALEERLRERVAEAVQLQEELKIFMSLPDVISQTSSSMDLDESQSHKYVELDVASDEVALNEDVFLSIKQLHDKMEKIYKEKMDGYEFEWKEQMQRLQELWTNCLTPEEDRRFDISFYADTFKPSMLEEMAGEIKRLEEVYESRRAVYQAVNYWRSLWDAKLAIETKKKDPNYYSSRAKGHSVTKDAQIERNLQLVKIPAAIEAVQTAYDVYLSTHSNQPFHIAERLQPLEYMDFVMNEYEEQRKLEKMAKSAAKKASAICTPSRTSRTPAKRTMLCTPTASGRNSPLVKKAALDRSIRMFGSATSLVSSITPKRTRIKEEDGPKTSSPVESSKKKEKEVIGKGQRMGPPTTTPNRKVLRRIQ